MSDEGTVLVSDRQAIARLIRPEGKQISLSTLPHAGFIPNGIGVREDGSLLVTNMGADGGVWALTPGKKGLEPFLLSVDGIQLPPCNYVLIDAERIWLTVSTRTTPINDVYNSEIADGLIVLIDKRGARIAAGGLRFANECRLSADRQWLYVAETAAARVSRFPVLPDGSLGLKQVFYQFDVDVYPEGLLFDDHHNLWLTSVVSNRIYRITSNTVCTLEYDDGDQDHIKRSRLARSQKALSRMHFYEGAGHILSAPTSLSFMGQDKTRLVVGSLTAERLPVFAIEIAKDRLGSIF